jgi:transposase
MPRVTIITVTTQQRAALEKQAKHGTTYSFRRRCQAVLLKTRKRTSLEVAQELGCCEMSVNDWLKRYQEQGLAGLQTKAGRGRKAILQTETDLATVRRAVQNSRQRIGLAKAELEQELGKEFSQLTLRRFLKKTVAVINELDDR